jgi:hypothetical protein
VFISDSAVLPIVPSCECIGYQSNHPIQKPRLYSPLHVTYVNFSNHSNYYNVPQYSITLRFSETVYFDVPYDSHNKERSFSQINKLIFIKQMQCVFYEIQVGTDFIYGASRKNISCF